jgi:hypothetical protein
MHDDLGQKKAREDILNSFCTNTLFSANWLIVLKQSEVILSMPYLGVFFMMSELEKGFPTFLRVAEHLICLLFFGQLL